MARVWVHSFSAVTDGGTGVFPIDGWLKATLPSMRWGLDDIGLHSLDATDPAISFAVIRTRSATTSHAAPPAARPCPGVSAGGAAAVTAYADYLKSRPGFDATATDTQVDGRQAVHVVLTPKPSFDCPVRELQRSSTMATSETCVPGQPHSLWLVEADGPYLDRDLRGRGVAVTGRTGRDLVADVPRRAAHALSYLTQAARLSARRPQDDDVDRRLAAAHLQRPALGIGRDRPRRPPPRSR